MGIHWLYAARLRDMLGAERLVLHESVTLVMSRTGQRLA